MSDNEILVVKVNEVYGRVVAPDWEVLGGLYNKFSVFVEKARWDKRYKAGQWDGKIHFVHKNGDFPVGLIQEVVDWLKAQEDYTVAVDPKFKTQPLSKKDFSKDFMKITEETFIEKCPFIPREHQIRGAIKSLYYGRAICEHCTGSGKSLLIALAANYIYQKNPESQTLIIVPTLDLVEQLTEDLIEYGVSPSLLGKFNGDQKDEDESIIISTWQSAHTQPRFLKRFEAILVDECHGLKADCVRKVSESAINAKVRLGFTGSMPDEHTDVMLIKSTLGSVVDTVLHKDLEALGQISKIKISIPFLKYSKETTAMLRKSTKKNVLADAKAAYNFESDFIQKLKERNRFIGKICKKKIEADHNTLVLANKHVHIDAIVAELKDLGIEPIVVTGKIKDIDERNRLRKQLELKGGQVLVATSKVFSTGVSIKRLHCVIFAEAGKSKIKTLQSVGRGLRQHATKSKLHLIDLADDFKYGNKHLEIRMDYYARNDFEVEVKEVQLSA